MKKINLYAYIRYLNDLLEIRNTRTSGAVNAPFNALDFQKSWEQIMSTNLRPTT